VTASIHPTFLVCLKSNRRERERERESESERERERERERVRVRVRERESEREREREKESLSSGTRDARRSNIKHGETNPVPTLQLVDSYAVSAWGCWLRQSLDSKRADNYGVKG
jgi:hypothetical protein